MERHRAKHVASYADFLRKHLLFQVIVRDSLSLTARRSPIQAALLPDNLFSSGIRRRLLTGTGVKGMTRRVR